MTLARFEAKFSVLDQLPESIYSAIVTHHHGDLITRSHGILQWRDALLAGNLPEETDLNWPAPELARAILMRLETLELAELCYQQEAITDSVLLDICEGITSAEQFYAHKGDSFVDKLAQRQKIRDKNSSFKDEQGLADHVEVSQPPSSSEQNDLDSDRDDELSSEHLSDLSTKTGVTDRGTATEQGQIDQPTAKFEKTEKVETTPQLEAQRQSETDNTDSRYPPHKIAEPVSDASVSGGVSSASEFTTPIHDEAVPDKEMVSLFAPDNQLSAKNSTAKLQPSEDITGRGDSELQEHWQILAENWNGISSAYKQLSGFWGTGWDLTPGQLQTGVVHTILQYQQKLRETPVLTKLVASLGRHKSSCEITNNQEQRKGAERPTRETYTSLAVMEAGGIIRTDSLCRMLPAESLLLGHPRLKMLWHAKRAEQLLLGYQYSGLTPEQTDQKPDYQPSQSATNSKLVDGKGPIIICLDTSASMQGQPEEIAKALVLEAIRIARTEQRDCHIYCFGSSDEAIEYTLSSNAKSISELLGFLQQSFSGGTNVCQPLLAALKKHQQKKWRNADILLLSDGRFPVQVDLFEKINRLKKNQGLRIHGILLGNWRGRAMEALSEPMHRYSDW